MIGLRIKTGRYNEPGFGILPRAVVWGFLGVWIAAMMKTLSIGVPAVAESCGIEGVAAAMKGELTPLKFIGALLISLTMNTTFAPVFMTLHKLTDTHILHNGGSLRALVRPIPMRRIISSLNWEVQWGSVFKKTIPFFWIPAHTITFLLAPQYQVLFAALLGVMLGILLSVDAESLKKKGFAFANAYSAQQRWVIFLYTGYRLVESFSDVWHGYLQKAERMDIVGVSFGVRGLVTAATVVAGLLLTRDLVITLAVLLALNAAYVLAVDLPLARKRADLAAKGGAGVGALLLECLPLAVYASLNTAIPSVPRYYCERLLGRVELDEFASVFLPVLVLQVAVVYLFVPFITSGARLWQGRQ